VEHEVKYISVSFRFASSLFQTKDDKCQWFLLFLKVCLGKIHTRGLKYLLGTSTSVLRTNAMLLITNGCTEQRGSVKRSKEPEMWNWSASSGTNIHTDFDEIPSVQSEVISLESPTLRGHKSVPGKESEIEWWEQPQFWIVGGSVTPIQPPVLWDTGTVSLVVKRPRCETNHFLQSNVEVKND